MRIHYGTRCQCGYTTRRKFLMRLHCSFFCKIWSW